METFIKLNYFSSEQLKAKVPSMNFFKETYESTQGLPEFMEELIIEQRFKTLTGVQFEIMPADCGEFLCALHGSNNESLVEECTEKLSDPVLQKCFTLQATLLNKAVSQISRTELTLEIESDIQNMDFEPVLAQQIYKFYCYLILAEYKMEEKAVEILGAFSEFLQFLGDYEPDLLTLETLLCTNYICFPYNFVKFVYFQNLAKASDLTSAYRIISDIPSLRSQAIETLALMGKHSKDEALEIVENALNSSESPIERSEFTMLKGEILDEKEYFEEAIELYSRNARAHRDLGLYYMTAFKEHKLDKDEEKSVVIKAIEHLTKGWSLEPSDRVCRENLSQLLLITRSGLEMCIEILVSLDEDFPKQSQYLHNIAMAHYALNDKKRSLEYFMLSLKCDNQFDVEGALHALQLTIELDPKDLSVLEVHFLMTALINRFNLYIEKHEFESSRQKETYAMNFIWQINESADKMGNWLIDEVVEEKSVDGRKREIEPIKQLVSCYTDLMARFAGTEAADECMLNYSRMMDRIIQLEK